MISFLRSNSNRATLLVACFCVAITGCQQPGTATTNTNPFLAPDCVPPPTTRVYLAPGTAQPYYPGDTLPPYQSNHSPTQATPHSVASVDTQPSTPAWPTTQSTNTFVQNASFTSAPQLPNNSGIAIPQDQQNLRFVQTPMPVQPVVQPTLQPIAQPTAPQTFQTVALTELPSLVQYNQPTQPNYATPRAPPTYQVNHTVWPSQPQQQPSTLQPVSHTQPLPTTANSWRSGGNVPISTAGQYGYDQQHQWLRGRLEYSQGTGQWKLRYVPIDGTTDEFGGSVLIQNPEVLRGFQPGSFIIMQGQLDSTRTDLHSNAPVFTVVQIRSQG